MANGVLILHAAPSTFTNEIDAVVNFGYVWLGYAFFGDLATIMT